eukprot:TRINITY_DN10991_c0_g1_i2.p1 TRINITY_DN10991_c0_g1~~TRINITY_DN10991_c0_g1_i2.p1  ORF type:complete len:305 (-),score=76.87 TRINITY_DN10991_c0_g1_i2:597-1511(-)
MHSSFKVLFAKEWPKVLKKRLEDYLDKALPSLSDPLLYKMLEVYQRHSAHKEEAKINENLRQKYMKLDRENKMLVEQKEKQEQLHLESQASWLQFTKATIAMSKKLLTTMSSLQGHQRVSNRFLTISKDEINNFETQLTKQEAAYNTLQEKKLDPTHNNLLEKEIVQKQKVREADLGGADLFPSEIAGMFDIDYKKLKEFLVETKDELKLCAVLQALVWRITNRGRLERSGAISDYTTNDLLSLKDNVKVLKHLLRHSNKKVVKYALVLLNELLAEEPGVNYLISNQEAMSLLIGLLKSQVINS